MVLWNQRGGKKQKQKQKTGEGEERRKGGRQVRRREDEKIATDAKREGRQRNPLDREGC